MNWSGQNAWKKINNSTNNSSFYSYSNPIESNQIKSILIYFTLVTLPDDDDTDK